MLSSSEGKLEVDSRKMQPLPVCGSPSVLESEHDKPHLLEECNGASLIDTESFMSLNMKDGGDGEGCACGQSPNASIPAFGKLKMLMSEACHKNYVIFDRSEGKNTVIVHPSWLNNHEGWLNNHPYHLMPEPYFAQEAKYFVGGLQTCDHKSIEAKLNGHSSAALSMVKLPVPLYNEAIGMQLQQKMASSHKARCSLVGSVNFGHAQNMKKDIMKPSFFLDGEESSDNEFHENTDEIDALLNSDDELSSTGHSPGDALSNCIIEAKYGHGNIIIGTKRKLGYSTSDELDDADSGSHKLAPNRPFLNSKRSEKRSAINDIFAEKSDCKSMESCGTFGSGPVDSSKRNKIKKNVQQLRSAVPGGGCLDTAGVLCHTIQYVKCLQRRLRDLEAAREHMLKK